MSSDFEKMSGPELVSAYNELVEKAHKEGVGDYHAVRRFPSVTVGINRCKGITTALKAAASDATLRRLEDAVKPKIARRVPSVKAKPKAKAKTATKAKVEKQYASKICEAFDVRSGSNREALLKKLEAHLKEPVPMRKLFVAVYGSADEGNRGKLLMVMKGLLVSISRDKLPFRIVKSKNEDKEVCFALHPGK